MNEPRKGSVLVVEDDESLLALFERVLQQSGFEACSAATVAAARSLMAERRFDILVCDLSVTGERNVFKFVSSVRAWHPEIAVLIISGYMPDEISRRAQCLGVMILDKPFSPPDLLHKISALLDRRAA